MYLENLVIDAGDPRRLGGFWEAALGAERLTDEPEGFETRLGFDGWYLDLCFQRVPEPVSEPPRLHVDLLGGSEHAEVVERAVKRAIKRVVGQATDSHAKAVKAALADASAKMSTGNA